LEKVSVVIVGAGVVGCALAKNLARDRTVVVLEKLGEPGLVTSRRNSGVIHSGIHLPPDSLKARLARRGKQLVEEHCSRHQVPFSKVGMHILVAREDFWTLWPELGRLIAMLRRASTQRIPVRLASRRAVREREPFVECQFGLFIPAVGIIHQGRFVESLEREARGAGARFVYGSAVQAAARNGGSWRVCTRDHEFEAECVINAAGLNAADVAKLAGFTYQQVFYRGEYYEVDRQASGLELHGLVYPVHRPGRPGLGVHLTATIDGRILVGPNAKPIASLDEADRDLTPAEEFHAEAVKFLPGLRVDHLRWAYAGIRPKPRHAAGEVDFVIRFEPGSPRFVNLIGIESPGLTASLALAEHVRRGLDERLN